MLTLQTDRNTWAGEFKFLLTHYSFTTQKHSEVYICLQAITSCWPNMTQFCRPQQSMKRIEQCCKKAFAKEQSRNDE